MPGPAFTLAKHDAVPFDGWPAWTPEASVQPVQSASAELTAKWDRGSSAELEVEGVGGSPPMRFRSRYELRGGWFWELVEHSEWP